MFIIDKIAYNNSLRSIHPLEKFIFSFVTIGIVISSSKEIIPLITFILMSIIILYKIKLTIISYIKLIIIPVLYTCIAVLTIIFIISQQEFDAYFILKISNYYIGISPESLDKGIKLSLKILSSTACFYCFILSTPLIDFEYILIKIHIPPVIRELFILIYRFIFIILNISENIYISQKSRMGYSTFKRGLFSLGNLITSVFLKSYSFNKRSYEALISRGYSGEFQVLRFTYKVSIFNWILIFFLRVF